MLPLLAWTLGGHLLILCAIYRRRRDPLSDKSPNIVKHGIDTTMVAQTLSAVNSFVSNVNSRTRHGWSLRKVFKLGLPDGLALKTAP